MYVCVCIYVCIVGGSKQKYNLRNNLTTYFNIKHKYSSHTRDVPYFFACSCTRKWNYIFCLPIRRKQC